MVKHITSLLLLIFVFGFVHNPAFAQGTENFKPVPLTTLSLNEAWQRQQVLLTLEIATPDEFARLEVEELDLSDFEVIELPFERVVKKDSYKVKTGWILFPLVSGQYEIELPKIYYRPNSGRKIKLKIPLQKLTVKSLPSYIPATMPIGKVAIKNTVQAGNLGMFSNLHDTQTLINWDVELITMNVLPQTIPPILRQVKTSKALDVFPETVDKKITKTYQGLKNNIHYTIPVKALRSGLLNLPELTIQYFDPNDAKLKRTTSQASTHWVLNRYLQWILLGLILVGALIALLKLYRIIQAYRLQRRMIHQAINAIEQAKNTQEIRTALHNLSQAKGWQANTTLQQLLKNWQAQKGQDLVLDSMFNELQTVQFSKNAKVSFDKVKNGLINSLKQA
jgi:hypothetical protein